MRKENNYRGKIWMPLSPTVTIGVLSYNYSKYIHSSLNSLLNQTYQNIELIIIDDCSSDDCVQKIEQWIKSNDINCNFIKHAKNLGITKTSNEIVKLANGKYIVFFATDDIMLPQRIEKQVEVLEQTEEDYGLCYARPQFMDEESILLEKTPFKTADWYEGDVLIRFLKREFGFIPPTAMIKKIVYDKIGVYNENVLIEDYNLFVRLVAVFKVKYCTYPCIIYRIKKHANASVVFHKLMKNNCERYFYERIISNVQALPFMKADEAKTILKGKINQYIKSLAAQNSSYFWKSILYLFKNFYFNIPIKSFGIKMAKALKIMRVKNYTAARHQG